MGWLRGERKGIKDDFRLLVRGVGKVGCGCAFTQMARAGRGAGFGGGVGEGWSKSGCGSPTCAGRIRAAGNVGEPFVKCLRV